MRLIEALVKNPHGIITTEQNIQYHRNGNFIEKRNLNYNKPYWVLRETISIKELFSIVNTNRSEL